MTASPPRHARLLWPLVLLLVLLAPHAARADYYLRGLMARGRGDQYWIVTTAVDVPKAATQTATTWPADRPTETVVRRLVDPVAGTWTVDSVLGVTVTAAAPLDGGLAVLIDTGEWRLLNGGSSVIGPRPPDGLTLTNLASDGATLWALARVEGRLPPRLLRWTESTGWSLAAIAPPGCPGTAAIGVYGGTPYLAYAGAGGVHIAKLANPTTQPASLPATLPAASRWTEVTPPLPNAGLPTEDCDFITNAPTPTFGASAGDGKGPTRIDLFDLRNDTAAPFRTLQAEPSALIDLAVVGPTLRLVLLKDGRLRQTAVDDVGRGPAHDPVTLPDPAPPDGRGPEWVNLGVLALLTALTFTTLRPRPEVSDALAAALAGGLTVAPRWRRLAAGIIDLAPVLATAYWVLSRFEGTPDDIANTPTRFFLPLFVACGVYLVHVTVGECLTGRSIGKLLLGLRVATLEGGRPSAEQVLVRNLLRAVDCVGLVVLVLVTPLGQRLGDLAAKTVVVLNRSGPAMPDVAEEPPVEPA